MDIEARLEKLNEALNQVLAQIALAEANLADLNRQEAFVRGQITERGFDKEEEVHLPVYKTEDEIQKALDNRGKGFFGEDEEVMIEQRQEVFEREAQKKVDFIDESADG